MKHHYVGLEHQVRVLESGLEVHVLQGHTALYVDSPRQLTTSELNNCMQSNPELTPFYDQKWTQLTDEEHQALLEAKEKGEEDKFLDDLFLDSSRIVTSKKYSNPEHQYFNLVERTLKKKKER